jgi:hypothetical protein
MLKWLSMHYTLESWGLHGSALIIDVDKLGDLGYMGKNKRCSQGNNI